MKSYLIAPDNKSITCLFCFKTSFHPEDVKNRYCGNCHYFHPEKFYDARLAFPTTIEEGLARQLLADEPGEFESPLDAIERGKKERKKQRAKERTQLLKRRRQGE
jgi:hypothetical protein